MFTSQFSESRRYVYDYRSSNADSSLASAFDRGEVFQPGDLLSLSNTVLERDCSARECDERANHLAQPREPNHSEGPVNDLSPSVNMRD